MAEINIDQTKCTNCGGCYELCPSGVFARESDESNPEPTFPRWCISCGQCVSICPVKAVEHSEYPTGTITRVSAKSLPSVSQAKQLLKHRRSIRSFSDKPVEKETLEELIEAARFAPSSTNTQSTEYIVIQDGEILARISELTVLFLEDVIRRFESRMSKVMLAFVSGPSERSAARMIPGFKRISEMYRSGHDPILRNGPSLIIFHGRKSVAMSDANAHLALHNSALMANAMGLGCFYVGFVVAACKRDNKIPELLEIPARNRVFGALVVGWPKFKHKNWIQRRVARVKWV